jgi:phosphopantothenoylcysteine decarboxylase/phosphopantothenate--cysteine ligase
MPVSKTGALILPLALLVGSIIGKMSIFTNKRILLGVTGSIATYKAADLASKLTQAGAQVEVILTPAAEKFITPLTFQSVTGRKAYTDSDLWGSDSHVLHVELAHHADMMVIAPCTANTLAKLAHGFTDNLLTITAMATRSSILVALAMDAGMFEHPATQENMRLLSDRGVTFIGPEEGRLASGLTGRGRMVEPSELMGHIRLSLGSNGKLAGKKVVVTAGGTQEPLDPVRMLTNRSSGKQGYAIAQAALDDGASVVLIAGATSLTPPIGGRYIPVHTSREMQEAVLAEVADAQALIMVAAVADFRPKSISVQKIKKEAETPKLELEATPDILMAVAKMGAQKPQIVVGFAAESQDLLKNASHKLKSKELDMLVANDISKPESGFGSDMNQVTLLFPDGRQENLPLMSKSELADRIIENIISLLESR